MSLLQLKAIRGDRLWQVFSKGQHLRVEANQHVHGIDPFLKPFIEEALNQDERPAAIERMIRQLKREDPERFGHCGSVTATQLTNRRSVMKKNHEGVFAFDKISVIKAEAEKHIPTREEFYLTKSNLPAQITLGIHEQDVPNTLTGAVVIQYGLFYCCKAQLLDCAAYLQECRRLGLGVVLNSDFTFNLTKKRHIHGSLGGRTMVRQGDFMVHKYRPFVFALTCRESESSYQGMIECL